MSNIPDFKTKEEYFAWKERRLEDSQRNISALPSYDKEIEILTTKFNKIDQSIGLIIGGAILFFFLSIASGNIFIVFIAIIIIFSLIIYVLLLNFNLKNKIIELKSKDRNAKEQYILSQIKQNNLLPIPVTGLILLKDEIAYWSEIIILKEEKVVGQKIIGKAMGIGFRITRNISIGGGGYKGIAINQSEIVPVAKGNIIITNKRIAFTGDKRTFAAKLEDIINIQISENNAQFSENNNPMPKFLKFEMNTNIFKAVLDYAMKNIH